MTASSVQYHMSQCYLDGVRSHCHVNKMLAFYIQLVPGVLSNGILALTAVGTSQTPAVIVSMKRDTSWRLLHGAC